MSRKQWGIAIFLVLAAAVWGHLNHKRESPSQPLNNPQIPKQAAPQSPSLHPPNSAEGPRTSPPSSPLPPSEIKPEALPSSAYFPHPREPDVMGVHGPNGPEYAFFRAVRRVSCGQRQRCFRFPSGTEVLIPDEVLMNDRPLEMPNLGPPPGASR